MKAEILNALEPKLSVRKPKVRAGEPMKIGFLQHGTSCSDSLMPGRLELKDGRTLPFKQEFK